MFFGTLLCLVLFGCGYAKHKDPAIYRESSATAAQIASQLHATEIGGNVHQNQCCGSMEPLVFKGDWIVTKAEPFTDELLGKVVTYHRENGKLWMHRLASGNAKDGFIASGDNNARSEPDERVTSTSYQETCVAIWKADQP